MGDDVGDRDEIGRWFAHAGLAGSHAVVREEAAPAGGYSNELRFLTVDGRGWVLRFAPSGPPLFPTYDLAMQVAVQQAAGAAGVPVAGPILHEADPAWLGREFLAMPRVDGRHPGEAPMLTDWIIALDDGERRTLHDGFFDVLAAIHRIDPVAAGLGGVLRGAAGGLDAEITWWEDFARWACDGMADPDPLLDLFAACRAARPPDPPGTSLLWGDVRMGNVVVGPDLRPAAVFDWEMATIGPPESDVAWFTALTAMAVHFIGADAPGFRTRDEVVARHGAAIGRPLQDLEWHEAFAVSRAAAAHVRTGIAKAQARGREAPATGAHPIVAYARDLLGG